MKRNWLFGMLPLLALPLMYSCSDDDDAAEVVIEEEAVPQGLDTRQTDDRPYYWYEGHKEYLDYVPNGSFVMFYEKDREAVFDELAALGIDCSTLEDHDGGRPWGGVDEKGSAYEYKAGSRWMRVDVDCETLKGKLPHAIYISPLVINEFQIPFAISNKFYVAFGGSMSALEEVVKEYKVGIVGRVNLIVPVFIIWCTQESDGNALEIANKIYESGKVRWTEPLFNYLGHSMLG